MGTTVEYEIAIIIFSIVGVALAVVYAFRVAHAYRVYHDERAAVSLAKGIGLLVMAVGLLLSALGLRLESPIWSIAGLSIARGAFIALMATLVLADVRPGHKDPSIVVDKSNDKGVE
jgi:vacuolar-type H+-ATPase subunit I/STV1